MPSNYEIGSGLTEQELKTASWWVRNNIAVRRYGFGLLIAIGILTWGYTLWTVLDTYAISYPREQRITLNIANDQLSPNALAASAPQPIQASRVNIFDTTGSRQDFLVQISNQNVQWWAEFTYSFDLGGATTTQRTGYILPNTNRYLTELGWSSVGVRNANVIIDNIVWHRILPQDVDRDYNTWLDQRMQLKANNVAYTSNVLVDDKNTGQTTFLLTNPSSFGFWSVNLTVILYRGDTPAAVNAITLEDVKPGESRQVLVNWFENPMYITRTEVVPNVNFLDPSSYLSSTYF